MKILTVKSRSKNFYPKASFGEQSIYSRTRLSFLNLYKYILWKDPAALREIAHSNQKIQQKHTSISSLRAVKNGSSGRYPSLQDGSIESEINYAYPTK